MINRWSVPCVKQRTLLLLTNNDENATYGDSPEDIKIVCWALAVGAAAFAAAPTAWGAGGSLGQRPNVPEAGKRPIFTSCVAPG